MLQVRIPTCYDKPGTSQLVQSAQVMAHKIVRKDMMCCLHSGDYGDHDVLNSDGMWEVKHTVEKASLLDDATTTLDDVKMSQKRCSIKTMVC